MTYNSEFVIDKCVPMPTARWQAGMYPFTKMAVGDSFLVPLTKVSVASAAHSAQKPTGFRFCVRKTTAGYRVWRVS